MDEVKTTGISFAPTKAKATENPRELPRLTVKRFTKTAKLPTVAHPGDDIGYDLYSDEEVILSAGAMKRLRTGIGIQFNPKRGALVRDRSSMASQRVVVVGGVIDAGYRGEILVLLENHALSPLTIHQGDKIAQMIPITPETSWSIVEGDLSDSTREANGFGSSGK